MKRLLLAGAVVLLTTAMAPFTLAVRERWEGAIPDMTIVWTVTEAPCIYLVQRRLMDAERLCESTDPRRRALGITIMDGATCHIFAPAPLDGNDRFRVEILRHELAHCIPGNFNWHK